MAVSAGLIKRAKKQALKSIHRYKMGAIVFRKKKVISKGCNIPYKFTHQSELPLKYRKWHSSLHAEINALLSAKCDVKGASILIIRVNSRGLLMDSFPCPFCLMYIEHVGIRKVIYSTSDQEIKEHML